MSHDTYDEIIEKNWSVKDITLKVLLLEKQAEMGETAVIDFDRDIATYGHCNCGEHISLFMPVHKLRGNMLTCPKCSQQMSFDSVHSIQKTYSHSTREKTTDKWNSIIIQMFTNPLFHEMCLKRFSS